MTRRQMDKFRRILEARRVELDDGLRRKRGDLAVDLRGDPLERARAVAEREFALRTLHEETALLRKVKVALREIEGGTFGRCVSCDREIPPKRLEAVPWSLYCVSCQELAEQVAKEEFGERVEEHLALAS